MEGGECNEVSFIERFQFENCVADLFDVDCAGKRGFLCVVSLKLESLSHGINGVSGACSP